MNGYTVVRNVGYNFKLPTDKEKSSWKEKNL